MAAPTSEAEVEALAAKWYRSPPVAVTMTMAIRDEALLVAILRNQERIATAAGAVVTKAPASGDLDALKARWFGSSVPGHGGPISIRAEALLVAILRNELVLKTLATEKEAAGKQEWTAAPADEEMVKKMHKAWYGGRGPGSCGPVTIRDEALLVAIMRNQEATATAVGAEVAIHAPASVADVEGLGAKWAAPNIGSAKAVAIRDEPLLVAILRNQQAICDALAPASVEIVKRDYSDVDAAVQAECCAIS
eukprot:TRINITY_DN20879_c0_g1_i1.p1 TRINITY_DN20879_c0_g1~~TRINITY_DN20879_c0_g1_i1.p1  ORF type:complete len:250 (+),score=58.91 TRINITY_DN20879_c0_g1_i1:66-815(+)